MARLRSRSARTTKRGLDPRLGEARQFPRVYQRPRRRLGFRAHQVAQRVYRANGSHDSDEAVCALSGAGLVA
jgi:hypothetical protein